jgi:hypothetical protein
VYASEGAPTVIEWRLVQQAGKKEIVYVESGIQRWRQPLKNSEAAHFAYVDVDDKLKDAWPPKIGKYKQGELPAIVILVREGNSEAEPLAAAVLGPLVPPLRIYGYEQME